MADVDHDRVHDEAIVIDAVCPLMLRRQYIDWWIEGGATAAGPTVGAFERAGPTLKVLGGIVRVSEVGLRRPPF